MGKKFSLVEILVVNFFWWENFHAENINFGEKNILEKNSLEKKSLLLNFGEKVWL